MLTYDYTKLRAQNSAPTFREYRLHLGLSREKLAALAGVSFRSICEYENKRTVPNLTTARKIAEVMNLTLDELARSLER